MSRKGSGELPDGPFRGDHRGVSILAAFPTWQTRVGRPHQEGPWVRASVSLPASRLPEQAATRELLAIVGEICSNHNKPAARVMLIRGESATFLLF